MSAFVERLISRMYVFAWWCAQARTQPSPHRRGPKELISLEAEPRRRLSDNSGKASLTAPGGGEPQLIN